MAMVDSMDVEDAVGIFVVAPLPGWIVLGFIVVASGGLDALWPF